MDRGKEYTEKSGLRRDEKGRRNNIESNRKGQNRRERGREVK